ncbi:hypothetical protein [Saliniramus sp.]|uniref:hypothetical protein n=1 Tax=Saliniramus sp. TaxID=2986772 RepID=UPI002C6611A4|nr:hypothetical protein [Saliniramus sp.]HMB11466.1 hypothetical protein [Saliniramus sp.]
MSFLIRFLAVVSVIFYFSPERGGGSEGVDRTPAVANSLPAPAPLLDPMQEATAPRREDTPVDTIAAILQREYGQDRDAITQYARERLAEEIARGVGLDSTTTRE